MVVIYFFLALVILPPHITQGNWVVYCCYYVTLRSSSPFQIRNGRGNRQQYYLYPMFYNSTIPTQCIILVLTLLKKVTFLLTIKIPLSSGSGPGNEQWARVPVLKQNCQNKADFDPVTPKPLTKKFCDFWSGF